MNGLPIEDERVSSPLFILHCFKKLFIHVAKILVSSFFSATIYAYLHLLVELTY